MKSDVLKLKFKFAGKRFLKVFSASVVLIVLQFVISLLSSVEFPGAYTFWVGLVIAILLAVEKFLQNK